MNTLAIVLIVCLLLIIGLVGYSLCVVGARADRESEATMRQLAPGLYLDSGEFIPAEELNKPQPQPQHVANLSRLHPSTRAAMGRRA